MVARTDLPFLKYTIPHLVRACNFPFLNKVLFLDTAPLSGEKVLRPGIGTLAELRACCQTFIEDKLIDRVVDIDYSLAYQETVYQKHFGCKVRQTHNYKGYPILGSICSLENIEGDYLLHFDSDILLHQDPDYNWIELGIQKLRDCPEILAIRPLGGPPFPGIRQDQTIPQGWDDRGFYTFDFFSSRTYLLDRQRFNQFLPIPVLWRASTSPWVNLIPSAIRTKLNYWLNKGALDSWELMVSKKLEQTHLIRATMAAPQAWTLHPKDRSPAFIAALPQIIEKIEQGWYPPQQAGYYDLKSQYWL
jgi:hypothetical protein